MKKQIPAEQTEANIQQVLRLLSETLIQLEKMSKGLSEEKLRKPPGAGERSFVEVLAHLLNCEARTSEAIHLALLLKEPVLPPIHPERELGKLLRYDQLPFDELLTYFKFRRTVLLKVLSTLKESQWSRVIREEGKHRKESVYWRARGQALRELEHLQELELKLQMSRDSSPLRGSHRPKAVSLRENDILVR
jgi:hypothetical protein